MAIYFCKDCDVQFKKSAAYFDHRRKIHPKFTCTNCDKVFGVRKKFLNHIRVCRRIRKPYESSDTGPIISLSDYKRLPIVTAEDLDEQFKIYIDRKFGKKGVFRNEKTCKFCCKTFAIALDFADHIREHYNTIPLDATGVKSKFDFMKFMGLKIREVSDTDYSDGNTTELGERILANKITECKVVVAGERCKICDEPFKCITDLNLHIKKQHLPNRRNKVTLVLRIGEEVISRISLTRRHIWRSGKTRLESEQKEMYRAIKYYENLAVTGRGTEVAWSRGKPPLDDRSTFSVEQSYELEEGNNSQSVMRSGKDLSALCSQEKMTQPNGNTIPCPDAKGNTFGEVESDTVDEAPSSLSLYEASSKVEKETYDTELPEMYVDEYYKAIQFAEPWKDEILNDHSPWYSITESNEIHQRIDDEENDKDCFCNETIQPRLLPKEKSAWEEEHFNMLNFSGFPSIRKYSSDSKYQTDFSFPSDEESYDFQVQAHLIKKNDDDDEDDDDDDKDELGSYRVEKSGKIMSGYTGTIVAEKERTNSSIGYPRSFALPSEDKSFVFQQHRTLESGKGTLDPIIKKHSDVFIKEEIILDDCTFCIDDDYSSSSNLSG